MVKYALPALAGLLLLSTGALAQPRGMSYGYVETPQQNVIHSQWYDHLLEVSPGFRHYRMQKECGPVNFSPDLRQDCFGSFDQFEPMAAAH
jgi:hypothetical protein